MAQQEEEYQFDPFDDGSSKLVGEKVLANLETFVQDFSSQLRTIEEAIDETLSDVWDPTVDPISLSLQPHEQAKFFELVKTDNKLFNKIILVFTSLCIEMKKLADEGRDRFAAGFVVFGEAEAAAGEGDVQVQIGRMVNGFLVDMSSFASRVYIVVQNVVRQLASLYHPAQKLYVTSFKNIHLQTVHHHLADLLTSLITLDSIILNNEAFKHAWATYKRMTKSIRSSPGRYNVEEEQLVQFEKLLLSLEGQLLDGLLFQGCIEQEFDFPGLVDVRNNKVLKAEFLTNIQNIYAHIIARQGAGEGGLGERYIGLCALLTLYFRIWRDVNTTKPIFQKVWDLHKKIPLVHLKGSTTWMAPEFFIRNSPALVKALANKNISVTKFRSDYVANLDKNLLSEVQQLYLNVSTWMVRMESNLSNRADPYEILNTRIALLSKGPALGLKIGALFKELVYLHIATGAPLKKSHVPALFQCIELLKAIESTVHRRSAVIAQSMMAMGRMVATQLSAVLTAVRARLESSQKYSDAKLDILAAAGLALSMLEGAPTTNRLLILRLCCHVLFQQGYVQEQEIEMVKAGLKKLDLLGHLGERVREACRTDFLYWSRSMIPAHLQNIYTQPATANRLHYLCAGLRDVAPVMRSAVHTSGEELLNSYKEEIETALKNHILDRLCRDIETDLRLHIHSHLEVSERDPWKNGLQDLAAILHLRPLRLFDKTIDIKSYVGHYLDTTFYNLTTVALYDWQTYGEMRNLASEKYGLSLTEVHLPGQTLDQGLDVLEIMRNIHIFVSRYNYNLNNQIFVESNTPNKTINTINISHIANSIRTHGIGIMNTTVNFTYQFLRQKFIIFSQFLYDDHIKSRLYKDIRFFRESRTDLNNRYPYARSDTFNREIRKLGLTETGLSYLDQFRKLITEIGNAMGYIRMIRSGGLYYTSSAIRFVPDLATIPAFSELAGQAHLPDTTVDAARNVDGAISALARNFAEGTEYFKMLVNVFTPEFRDNRNAHLKNFYIIVPPLTLNFVQHVLKTKDKLFKKGATDPAFSDDGFAIGVAYILKLLDQNSQFDSLHWWEAVDERYNDEQAKLVAMQKQQKGKDKEEQQTLTLTMRKLASYRTEFQLLRFSFDGARIFFKD